jgi:hypothetical protein
MNTTMTTAVAPAAPGKLGTPLVMSDALRYLEALGDWRDQRKTELDELDAAAMQAEDADALTDDVLLSMALWKAVADRHDLLLATWDSGRVGKTELERLSALIWGRLDTAADPRLAGTTGALAVSLPEACKLSDALAASLRARLALSPGDADVAARTKQLRAQVERIRDQVEREPASSRDAATAGLTELDQRLNDIVDRAKRGADVGGLLGPLELDAARTERDLIVGSARRREDAADAARARDERTELAARGAAVRDLAARCVAGVTPAPKLAVPDVTALGPVPEDPDAVDAYLARLETVSRALTQAQAAYQAPLQRRDELEGLLTAYHAKSKASGEPADDLDELHRRAQQVLATTPVDVDRLGALVAAYQAYVAGGRQGGNA